MRSTQGASYGPAGSASGRNANKALHTGDEQLIRRDHKAGKESTLDARSGIWRNVYKHVLWTSCSVKSWPDLHHYMAQAYDSREQSTTRPLSDAAL